MSFYKANQSYNATTGADYTTGDSTLSVSSVPINLPTIVTVGRGTAKERRFTVTSTDAGQLTGIAWLDGATDNIPAGTSVECMNDEEFINQLSSAVFTQDSLKGLVYSADGGSSDDYEITLPVAPTDYSNITGLPIAFKANTANTGASTIDINELGVKDIKKQGASGLADLETGDILAGQISIIVYDGTQFQLTSSVLNNSIKAYVDNSQKPQSLYDNLLINGNMDISQRATTFVAGANNDDVYTLDQWNLLSDGNDVFDVSQEAVTDLAGSSYAIKLDVETAKRGGIIQFIEAKDAIKFRGQTVSLSFAVKSANISALRAGILSWDGTADTLTSDVVGTWGANPTPVANWTFENTPADLTVTSSWTTVKIEGIVLDTAGMNNLGIFIWTPNEETIGDIVYISQVKVNQGATATSFMPRNILEEKLLCYRHFFYSGVGTLGTGDGNEQTYGFKYTTSTSNLVFGTVPFPVEMRKAPVIRCYASTSGTGAGTLDRVRSLASGLLVDVSSSNIRTSTHGIVEIFKNASFTSGVHHAFNFSADATL